MRNAEKTRKKLLLTATQLLLDNGAGGLRVDEVANLAGVNKRMIYHYFAHKEGLYQEILQLQVAQLVARADQLSEGAKAFLQREIADSTPYLVSPDTTESLQDAGLIVLRALAAQRNYAKGLSEHDWQSMVQGLIRLGLPSLLEEDTASKKPRYRLQPGHRLTQ